MNNTLLFSAEPRWAWLIFAVLLMGCGDDEKMRPPDTQPSILEFASDRISYSV